MTNERKAVALSASWQASSNCSLLQPGVADHGKLSEPARAGNGGTSGLVMVGVEAEEPSR